MEKRKIENVQIRMDTSTKNKFKFLCSRLGLSQSEVVRQFIEEQLDNWTPYKQSKIDFEGSK